MRVTLYLLGCALLLTTLPAPAAYGWYFDAAIGHRRLADADLRFQGDAGRADVSGFGAGGSGAVGSGLPVGGPDWLEARLELEAGHAENEPKYLAPRGALATLLGTDRTIGLTGDVMATWLLLNLWLDARVAPSWLLSAGGGVGLAYLKFNDILAGPPSAAGIFLDRADLAFAYQGGVGIGYQLTPRLVVGVDYRYMVIHDAHYPLGGGTFRPEYRSRHLLLDLRYRLP